MIGRQLSELRYNVCQRILNCPLAEEHGHFHWFLSLWTLLKYLLNVVNAKWCSVVHREPREHFAYWAQSSRLCPGITQEVKDSRCKASPGAHSSSARVRVCFQVSCSLTPNDWICTHEKCRNECCTTLSSARCLPPLEEVHLHLLCLFNFQVWVGVMRSELEKLGQRS